MSKSTKNVKKPDDETPERKGSNKKKILAIGLAALALLAIFGGTLLSVGNIGGGGGGSGSTKPLITCNKGNNTLINKGDFQFFISAHLKISGVVLYYNGSTSYSELKSPYSYPVSLNGKGSVSFIVVAYDSKDNRTVAYFSFTYDTIPPNIYISPSNGSSTENDTFSMMTDSDIKNVTVTTDTYHNLFINSSFTISNPWKTTGTKIIFVTAFDNAGNENITAFSLKFIVMPPYITVARDVTNSSIITIHVNKYTNDVKVGNSSSTITTTVLPPYIVNMNWSGDGIHTAWVFVNTTIGTSYTISKSVTIDRTPPSFMVSPINGSVVDAVPLTFTIIDAHPGSIFVDGVNITSTMVYDPPWSIVGKYAFNVSVYDLAGNVNHSKLTYTLDTTPPVISLLSPLNGSKIVNKNGTIVLNVTDTAKVLVENVSYSFNNITFSSPLPWSKSPKFSIDLTSYFTSKGPGVYNVYFRATSKTGHSTYAKYMFKWSMPSNMTVVHPVVKKIGIYIDPVAANFTTDKTTRLGYFNQAHFNTIAFTLTNVNNTSNVYVYYQNVSMNEFGYSSATMNSTFWLLKNAYITHSSSYKPFSYNGSAFIIDSTYYLGGNSSWRLYVYYNDGVDDAIGTFVTIYDDKTPVIWWTSMNATTLYMDNCAHDATTYINFTATDFHLYSMRVVVTITNSSGTKIIYNKTVYDNSTAKWQLGFWTINSSVPYTLKATVTTIDRAGNIQVAKLQWTVTLKCDHDYNRWNYFIGIGVPVAVIFTILHLSRRRSKNNGSHIGGI